MRSLRYVLLFNFHGIQHGYCSIFIEREGEALATCSLTSAGGLTAGHLDMQNKASAWEVPSPGPALRSGCSWPLTVIGSERSGFSQKRLASCMPLALQGTARIWIRTTRSLSGSVSLAGNTSDFWKVYALTGNRVWGVLDTSHQHPATGGTRSCSAKGWLVNQDSRQRCRWLGRASCM